MEKKLTNKVAVVTGGSAGIGLGAAKHFVAEGAQVFITGRRQSELDKAVRKIDGKVTAVRADTSVLADIERIYEKVKEKLVLGENISQTASFVASGAADVGVVALALALSPNLKDKGRYAEIPVTEYPPIEQACVILNSSKDKETAKQFLSYIKTAAVGDTLRRYGFDVTNTSHDKP